MTTNMTAEVPTQGFKTQQVQAKVPPRSRVVMQCLGWFVTLLALCVPGGKTRLPLGVVSKNKQ